MKNILKKALSLSVFLFLLTGPMHALAGEKIPQKELERKNLFIKVLDNAFLDLGLDVKFRIEGKFADKLKLKNKYWSRPMTHKITQGGNLENGSFLPLALKAGFRWIIFEDEHGFLQVYDTYNGESSLAD